MPVVFPTVDSSSINLSDSTGFQLCYIHVDADMSAMGFVMAVELSMRN